MKLFYVACWTWIETYLFIYLFIYYFPTIKITQALHYTKMWRGDLRKPQGLYEEAPSLIELFEPFLSIFNATPAKITKTLLWLSAP